MDESKQQLIDKLKGSNNVLVTVGRNPSVDQLSALLGLTLFLNKQGKHAAAVFSGEIPSTIEFLQPEETIEKNTDSLRDFIIALDKSKADKLRYKVEDNVVRIFITPFKTSITQDDFEFSQGDFNVDVVLAIGVQQQEDLDEAIVAHGRILHDATVTTINTTSEGGIGTINWHNPGASSLSELATEIVQTLGKDQIDEQIATALLTGIVAETDRFSNDKTKAETMSISATLMQAGANQQLVASKLQEGGDNTIPSEGQSAPANDDGMLEISHSDTDEPQPFELPAPDENSAVEPEVEPETDAIPEENDSPAESTSNLSPGPRLITEPPTLGGTLTANSEEEALDLAVDPLSQSANDQPQMLTHNEPLATLPAEPVEEPPTPVEPPIQVEPPAPVEPPTPAPEAIDPVPTEPSFTPPPTDWTPPPEPAPLAPAPTDQANSYSTLAELEESIDSPHATDETAPAAAGTSSLDAARDEVSRALGETTAPAADQPQAPADNSPQVKDPTEPPEVPPPILFPFGSQPPQQ